VLEGPDGPEQDRRQHAEQAYGRAAGTRTPESGWLPVGPPGTPDTRPSARHVRQLADGGQGAAQQASGPEDQDHEQRGDEQRVGPRPGACWRIATCFTGRLEGFEGSVLVVLLVSGGQAPAAEGRTGIPCHTSSARVRRKARNLVLPRA